MVCPYCEEKLTKECAFCHKNLKLEWKVCPYCGNHEKKEEVKKVKIEKKKK
jgi:predicted amidophosphoribosyltransferase